MTTATRPTVQPITIGPTWQLDADGDFILPEHTLGWQQLGWTRDYLQQPDGPHTGDALNLTDEQARFLLWWSAIDAQGRFTCRYAMLRRMKGWGKDPLGAIIIALEFTGPCRFGGWLDGKPVAIPNPSAWIQTAAVSREQTRNTMTLFPGLFSPKAVEEYGIDIGKEILYADRGRRRVEAITSSPRAVEGGRPTFILKNETHHWIRNNEGHEMSAVIARNAAKTGARVLAISNAHAPGEDSDAERDYDAWRKIAQGLSPNTDMLYDSLEAPDDTDLTDRDSLWPAIAACRGDSSWVDPDRLIAEIQDPRTPAATGRRYYLNQIRADEDKPFDRVKFEALTRKGYTVAKGALITLGFDGSINRDHTALIGTEVATRYQWVVGYWEPRQMPSGEMSIAFSEVDQTVDYAFEQWSVWRMYADPYKWGAYLARWAGKHGEKRVVSWSTTLYRKMAQAIEQYRTLIESAGLSHDGDPRLIAAVANAHKHLQNFRNDDGEQMYILQKERMDSPLKIDAVMAAIPSMTACDDAIALGALNPEPSGISFYIPS